MGRAWVLAWLVGSSVASGAALAQAEVDAVDPVAPATDAPAPDPLSAPRTDSVESADSVPDLVAEERDPVATNEQLVATTLEQFGRKSLQTAEAYVDLADAQRQAKLHELAAENYLAAVEVYRAVDGPFTPLAIAPLTRLGDNYHEADDDVNAVASYSEARTVSRRAYGLHNEAQIELLDRMSRSLLDLNQLTEAEEQQVEALRLIQRSNPPDSDAVLEAIYRYAEWLGQRLQFQLERDQYMRALRIIRATHGDRDVRQVRALLGIGNTYREERNPAGTGISALQEAHALLLAAARTEPRGDRRRTARYRRLGRRVRQDGLRRHGVPACVANACFRAQRRATAPPMVLGRQLRALRADQPTRLEHRPQRIERPRHRQVRHRYGGQ